MNPAAPSVDDEEELSSEFFNIYYFGRRRRNKDVRPSVTKKMNSCYSNYPFAVC